MNQKKFVNIILIIVVVLALSVVGYFIFVRKTREPQLVVQPRVENIESQARSAVEKVLATSSMVPKNSKLLSLSVDKNKVTINFNKDIMNNGHAAFEDIFQQISNVLHPIIQGTDKDPKYSIIDYTVLIEGVPLNTYLATANWKTYQNEKFGFKFKYPVELEASSSGPNEEQKKLDRGETISGTVPPSYDTIAFSDSANQKEFNVIIFPVRKDEVSPAGFRGYLSMGSVCDTRWIDSVSEGPTLLNKSSIPILEVQIIPFGPGEKGGKGEYYACYYFKNSRGNLIVFNVFGFSQGSNFSNAVHLVRDKILSTFSLIK